MKFLTFSFLFTALCISYTIADNPAIGRCVLEAVSIPKDWITMRNPCTDAMKAQVNNELRAALTYMAMGAHFAQDKINRPGFSKMFFESASEEREHAIKIIKYLIMRGGLLSDLKSLISSKIINPTKLVWTNGVHALNDALVLETQVTRNIENIIEICENSKNSNEKMFFNDYHLVDYLTGEFLEEQLKGQEDIAKKLTTLMKMEKTYKSFGEFLFDKKLLNGEPL